MGARSGNAAKIIETVRAGKTTPEALMHATGLDRVSLSSTLGYMRRQGQLAYDKISATQIDWATMRVGPKAPTTAPAKSARKVPRQPEPVAMVAPVPVIPLVASVAKQPTQPLTRAYVDTARLSRARELLISAADELGAAIEGGLGAGEYLRALADQIEVRPVPVEPLNLDPVVEKPQAPRSKGKRFRVEDGMGNELTRCATLADARKRLDRDDNAMRIVDTSTGTTVQTRRDPDEEE